ncbi:hypothetical protein GQ44DRAFT_827614 [Phaeosphaeriaceae sp. PMI808]|nr:hypothetical protein GQ44DRAFT_827614 [Phaeosphaeriaceae sp. PMI808]
MTNNLEQHKRPLGTHWSGTLTLDISPSSTTPSSPGSENGSIDSSSEEKLSSALHHLTLADSQEDRPDSQEMSITQGMVQTLHSFYEMRMSPEVIAAYEEGVVNYLHNNAVTLEDVKTYIPCLNFSARVIGKLMTNIGLYHSWGCISEEDLEQMLTHLFVSDDYNPWQSADESPPVEPLIDRAMSQIRRFKHERAINVHSVAPDNRRLQRIEQQEVHRNEALEAKRRRNTVPFRYRQPSIWLPFDASCIGDIFTECHGMSWDQAIRIQEVGDAVGTNKAVEEHNGKAAQCSRWIDPVDGGTFSQTRATHGPWMLRNARTRRKGLRKARVQLPPQHDDKWVVVVTVSQEDALLEATQKIRLQTKSDRVLDALFPKQQGGSIAVRLPSV